MIFIDPSSVKVCFINIYLTCSVQVKISVFLTQWACSGFCIQVGIEIYLILIRYSTTTSKPTASSATTNTEVFIRYITSKILVIYFCNIFFNCTIIYLLNLIETLPVTNTFFFIISNAKDIQLGMEIVFELKKVLNIVILFTDF